MAVPNVIDITETDPIPVKQFITIVTTEVKDAIKCFTDKFNRTPETVYRTANTIRIGVTEQEFENAKSRARIITH
jgi:hypothetical protein